MKAALAILGAVGCAWLSFGCASATTNAPVTSAMTASADSADRKEPVSRVETTSAILVLHQPAASSDLRETASLKIRCEESDMVACAAVDRSRLR